MSSGQVERCKYQKRMGWQQQNQLGRKNRQDRKNRHLKKFDLSESYNHQQDIE